MKANGRVSIYIAEDAIVICGIINDLGAHVLASQKASTAQHSPLPGGAGRAGLSSAGLNKAQPGSTELGLMNSDVIDVRR